mmetsp:Transcript_7011/g.11033  ORF Transcript_7011/g.11033 Transcript_7011/m.11033 type:complete len:226 (+) Transcript_7011:38-715(+)
MPWVKFIFPSAPNRAVTINMGAQMPAWADIKGLSPEAPEDEEGSLQTKDYVHQLVAKEIEAGIPANRILIGGFSQGGAMAGLAALTHPSTLGGCFVLSGYVALKNKLPSMLSAGAKQTPFFQAHGTNDMVVPFLFGQVSSQLIAQFGVKMEFKQYSCGHEAHPQELQDLRTFLVQRIPQKEATPIPTNVGELSVKELKEILKVRNIDSSDCFEKEDLVRKVKSLL